MNPLAPVTSARRPANGVLLVIGLFGSSAECVGRTAVSPLSLRERVGVRGFNHFVMNTLKNGLRPVQHFMIPKSQNPVTQGFQIGRPLAISVLLFLMLATIGLNHQFDVKIHEINDVRLNHQLASEPETTETTRPQVMPQQAFCIRHLTSQHPGQ
jgi:hypothetical protein